MPTARECVCCHEIDNVKRKIEEESSSNINCIIEHEGFQSVCLDVWVLQTAYFSHKSSYGDTDVESIHE